MKAALLVLAVAQAARGEEPFAIFTDIDGTFVSEGTQHISDGVVATAAKLDYPLIAMTGRESARVLSEIDRGELPMFSAIITGVGTEIRVLHGQEYQPDEAYHAQMAKTFDKPTTLVNAQAIVRTANPALNLKFQERAADEPYRVSLQYTAPSEDEALTVAAQFKRAFPDYKVIISEDIYKKDVCNLDIVPAGKDDAVRYIMRKYGFARGLVAGDSENDLDALAIPELTAIWVEGHSGPSQLLDTLKKL